MTSNASLIAGFVPPGLPAHQRDSWTRDETHLSPDGRHFLTLYGITESPMGHITCRAAWGAVTAPASFTALARLPLQPVHHWLSDSRFALKILAYQRDWIRPLLVIDLALGMSLVPLSNSAEFAPTNPDDTTFKPYNEAALAMDLDLTHLI